ncbi:MAG: DUF4129 domain-containing protein [Desulfobacteraceae bacterium]|jgi:hypothetical protein|nr:DUF4129 domain-containing protein [Desulfobacteraceae bacterium]
MKQSRKKYQKSALRVIDEAVHLLRTAPGLLLSVYYLGGVPFVLGLLYFWADMSRSPNATEYSAAAALGLSFLFVWMKVWQTIFALRVHERISGDLPQGRSLGQIASIAATQTLIQATRFIVMPVAALLVVPFGYCYAFYHNAAVSVGGDSQDFKPTCQWAWRQARLWPRQNHLLISIFWLFGFVIFLNVSMATLIFPQLMKSLFGIETVFTLGGMAVLINSTFWIAMLGMTYLLVDPLVKTAYVIRCFYGSALGSGDDLKTELNRILNPGAKFVAGLLIVVLSATPILSIAETTATVAPDELNQSIEEIINRPEFSWRLPRETIGPKEPESRGPLAAAFRWLLDMITRGIKTIKEWITNFIDWLESLFPESEGPPVTEGRNWKTPVRIFLLLLLFLFLAIMAFIFLRIWQRQRIKPVETISTSAIPVPDLNDERVKADDLATNRWLSLAGELADKGELRLAMRALYLATLAHLAAHEMITIEISKSNREYEHELKRRAHEHAELISIFSDSLNVFERIWYGMYHIARSEFDNFARNQKRILAFAEK